MDPKFRATVEPGTALRASGRSVALAPAALPIRVSSSAGVLPGLRGMRAAAARDMPSDRVFPAFHHSSPAESLKWP